MLRQGSSDSRNQKLPIGHLLRGNYSIPIATVKLYNEAARRPAGESTPPKRSLMAQASPTENRRTATILERALRQDRAVVVSGIIAIAAIAWAYVVYVDRAGAGMDMGMGGMAMADMSWGAADFVLMFLMWAVMMTAMMAPSATPVLLMFAAVNRRRKETEQPFVPTAVFLAGYLLAWTGFSVLATMGNWGLHQASLLSSMMGESTNAYLGGSLLLAAGIFQLSPLKLACLTHCRSPMGFVMTNWRDGRTGAIRMGLEHGAYCLGCCWALMALLFVLGVMNLAWIAALAAFVLVEKVSPKAELVSRVSGVALIAWGIWTVLTGVL